MVLLQFQFTNTTEEEQDLIPEFCFWLGRVLYSNIDTKINRKKIRLRINYILEKARWVEWNKDKYNLTVAELMNTINNSITYKVYRGNIWKILIDTNILIPHSYTSIDRFIRFLNYGDNVERATGIFTNLEKQYNHTELNSLWKIFILKELGYISQAKILTR